MSPFRRLLQFPLARFGCQLAPFNPRQVIPETTPDPELYVDPEDFLRSYRPWLGEEFGRLLTTQVASNTGLSRQKLCWLLQMCSQTQYLIRPPSGPSQI